MIAPQAVTDDAEAGIAEMKAGLEAYRLTGSDLMTTQFCLMMAEAQLRACMMAAEHGVDVIPVWSKSIEAST